MGALVLVVDDRPTNVLLLETKLSNELYDVITAQDGYEAVQKTKEFNPDVVLLDVMMPGIDGFEVCRRLRSDPDVAHTPVIMVTALSSRSDRVRGLDVGADDFMTKPFNDTVFFSRTRSLVRIKNVMDELRLRDRTLNQLGVSEHAPNSFTLNVAGAKILLVAPQDAHTSFMLEKLTEHYEVQQARGAGEAMDKALHAPLDAIIINAHLGEGTEGLELASQIKGHARLRHIPIILMVQEGKAEFMLQALALGINDYLLIPFDHAEMLARVKNQLRRKKYHDLVKENCDKAVARLVMDEVTGLFNQNFLDKHLERRISHAQKSRKPTSLLLVAIDAFQPIRQNYGESVALQALNYVADAMTQHIRTSDTAARLEDGTFAIILPETELQEAAEVAERICQTIDATPLSIDDNGGAIHFTLSIGAAQHGEREGAVGLMRRTAMALSEAQKAKGNQVHLA